MSWRTSRNFWAILSAAMMSLCLRRYLTDDYGLASLWLVFAVALLAAYHVNLPLSLSGQAFADWSKKRQQG